MELAVADILPYRPPREREETTAWVGMVVFLASWAMMFAALFFGYGMVRSRYPQWPPPELPLLPLLLPGLNTLVLAGSSAALQYGLVSLRRGRAAVLASMTALALLLGATFITLQSVVWVQLWALGLRPGSGAYGSVFYALTVFHALHVTVGLCALAVLALRARRGDYNPARHLAVRLWAMYWHFVGVVWGLMFALLYLV
jgi:heme/copper-type cytochrome/quinol oxidase subunit 3